MSVPQICNRFLAITRWLVVGVATVGLAIAFAAPSFSSTESTITPHSAKTQEVQDVAWRGRVYRRAYYGGPVYRPYYGAYYGPQPYYRSYYGPGPYYRGYYGGGAVVTPWARVYW
ncbi:hypothetical protein LOC68_06495 [Blastopirellula sp. JC732]|uniref:Uncharacterized protein n=1 Tax=Blastopirellula sediminis TaxID=2894196 RepID=A0A9X1MJ51_9BACT|nr:hypothetical protein [Blastopirellula sediminis]MCC9609185.1 hypothetical protein [Blastopirellula sediminis]MCC9628038.1 hypothetical protein [Blastopirellula sediminis]